MLANFYIEGYSYQENMLPKYQKLYGHEIKIIASMFTFDENGEGKEINNWRDHLNEHEIPIVRLNYIKSYPKRLRRFFGLYEEMAVFEPDIIFIHGIQFADMDKVLKYKKKHPSVKVFVDNHADLKNSARNFISRVVLHGIIWKYIAKKSVPYVEKYYGVTPARVDFLINIYKLPKEKVELLPLGVDDEIVKRASDLGVRFSKRKGYGLSDDDFVIITGGKIDYNKPQVIDYMHAVNQMKTIKLLVFGSVTDKLKEKFESQLSENVKYIGWKKSEDIYYEFAAADLVVFPGLHSVLWEQAVGMGKPCIFKNIEGFHHINLGGNCLFFENDSIEEYIKKTKQAINDINNMKTVASAKGMKVFSYKEIAKKSIQTNKR